MIRNILQIGAPILTKKTKQVESLDSKAKQVIQDLLDTVIAKKNISAGLAAPQIGEDLAICVCRRVDLESFNKKIDDNELWEVMINPKIIFASNDDSVYWEACLSIGLGGDSLYGPVSRPNQIKIEYLDKNFHKKQINAEEFFSHEIQHEIDHLHGILFLKYVSDPQNIWKKRDLDKYYNENGDYPPV